MRKIKTPPLAYIQTDRDGYEELVWDRDEELEGLRYAYTPLYDHDRAKRLVVENTAQRELLRQAVDELVAAEQVYAHIKAFPLLDRVRSLIAAINEHLKERP